MSWNNVTSKLCSEIWGLMHRLHDAGVSLPDGKTPDTLSSKAGELLDYGQRVADDDAFWEALPANLVPSAATRQDMARAAQQLAELSANPPLSAQMMGEMVAQAQQGKAREELRQELRNYLDLSRSH